MSGQRCFFVCDESPSSGCGGSAPANGGGYVCADIGGGSHGSSGFYGGHQEICSPHGGGYRGEAGQRGTGGCCSRGGGYGSGQGGGHRGSYEGGYRGSYEICHGGGYGGSHGGGHGGSHGGGRLVCYEGSSGGGYGGGGRVNCGRDSYGGNCGRQPGRDSFHGGRHEGTGRGPLKAVPMTCVMQEDRVIACVPTQHSSRRPSNQAAQPSFPRNQIVCTPIRECPKPPKCIEQGPKPSKQAGPKFMSMDYIKKHYDLPPRADYLDPVRRPLITHPIAPRDLGPIEKIKFVT